MAQTYKLVAHTLVAISTAFLLLLLVAIRQAQGEPASLLKLEAFRVSARVRIIRSNSNQIDQEILIEEYYSNLERRSRLDIRFIDRSKYVVGLRRKLIQYYYDGSTGVGQLVRLSKSGGKDDCALVDGQRLADDLFGELSSADQHMTNIEWLKERGDVPDYVIGFARMLVVVEANRNRLRQNFDKIPSLIRSREAIKYNLMDPLGSSGLSGHESEFLIYFGRSMNEIDELPLRIWLVQAMGAEIIVDYSLFSTVSFDVIAANDFIGTYHSFPRFLLQTGCSGLLAKADLIQERPAPKLISFRMNVVSSLDDTAGRKYFLAYDGYMGLMRRDELDANSDSASSTTIYDYRAQRKYNIRYGSPASVRPASSGEFNAIDTMRSQCAVASMEHEQAPELEPLLPFKDMVWMGRGYARGMEVIIFEQIAASLPEILITQATTMTSNGPVNTFKPTKSDFLYSIVYYFAPPTTHTGEQGEGGVLQMAGKHLGPLIRVEATKGGLAYLVIDLEEFLWQLADAPNGDRSTELFSLGDACYGHSLRRDSFATMKLELNFAPIGDTSPDKTFDEAYTALRQPVKRNKALVRALSGAAGIPATLIYDLNSRLIDQQDEGHLQARIHVNAKLNLYQNPALYELVYVGNGAWQLVTQRHTDAGTFDDCFWDAMHLRGSGEVLFTFCFHFCIIEQGVELEYNLKDKTPVRIIKSEGFDPNSVSACKIYSLRRIDNTNETTGLASRVSIADMREKLKVDQLTLPMPFGEKVDQVQLSVKRIQIGNTLWSSDSSSLTSQLDANKTGGAQTMVNEGTLKGVGLMIGSDGLTTRVQPKQTTLASGDDYDELGGLTDMNYSLCHSICLATIKCRSFSLCSGTGQLECLISELEFRDPDLLASIEQQVSVLRNMPKRTATATISGPQKASIEPSGDSEQDDDVGQMRAGESDRSEVNIELRVDRRCHLYNKQALELFHPPGKAAAIDLRSKHLVAVDSAEQCAEICLQGNKRYFERSTKGRKQALDESLEQEQVGSAILTRLQALEGRNLRSWCRSFGFIDLYELHDLFPAGVEKLDSTKLTKSGLCYPTKGPSATTLSSKEQQQKDGDETSIHLPMHKFDFLYSSLYEPQYGFKLRPFYPAPKKKLDQMTMEEIREFVRDGNMQVVSRIDDVEVCAKLCFLQIADLEPWCRSFGQHRELVAKPANNSQPELQSYCIFNTITMTSALKSSKSSQLISPALKNISFVHYEPRNLLNLETVILDQLLVDGRLSSELDEKRFLFKLFQLKYSKTGILILLALSLATGLTLVQFIVSHLGDTNTDDIESSTYTTGQPTASINTLDGGILAKISSITNRKEMDLARLVGGDEGDDV